MISLPQTNPNNSAPVKKLKLRKTKYEIEMNRGVKSPFSNRIVHRPDKVVRSLKKIKGIGEKVREIGKNKTKRSHLYSPMVCHPVSPPKSNHWSYRKVTLSNFSASQTEGTGKTNRQAACTHQHDR